MVKFPVVHKKKTGRYIHITVRDKKRFKPATFRTHDIGRPGHSKRVAGKLKKTNRWATQKFLVLKSEEQKVSKFKAQAKAQIRREKKHNPKKKLRKRIKGLRNRGVWGGYEG